MNTLIVLSVLPMLHFICVTSLARVQKRNGWSSDGITETVPFKFALGYGTSKFDLSFADSYHFPVALARTAINVYLLPDSKRIWPENNNLVLHINWHIALFPTMP